MGRPSVQTYSGALVDLADPQPETLLLEDIAHHLSMTCRYNGAVREFWSVAQHSVLVLRIVEWIPRLEAKGLELGLGLVRPKGEPSREELAWALLHDAGEAYVGDLISPVRRMVGAPFDDVERRILDVLTAMYSLPREMPEIVRVADELALAMEAHHLLPGGPRWPVRHVHPAFDTLAARWPRSPEALLQWPRSPVGSEAMWLRAALELQL